MDTRDFDPNSEPRYPPISAKEHLMAKHAASMGVDVEGSELEKR